ncbi:hypothetical protein CHS0354_009768 [Potamilus streckersoni]|uniref:TIR domain-containing protein n=1 Tax=Potamilus streckersoni TaxID=2493646 RepID=A0AAE0W361_9BIVA|nr:hypothetical protein CHS0354_009768 [Potamilus streckersoni]
MGQRKYLFVLFLATMILILEKECKALQVNAYHIDCKDVKCPENCKCTRQSVDCHHRNLKYIPRIPCGIKYLNLSKINISTLSMKEIANLTCSFETISHVNLRKCKIERLEEDVFTNLTKLEVLDLSANEISVQQKNNLQRALGSLNKAPLRTIKLDRLWIKNEVQEIFKYFEGRHVTYLSMQENQIMCFEDKVLENFTRLIHLNLHHNWIHKIDLSSGIPTLEWFDLSHNQFNIFPPNFCDNTTRSTRYNNLKKLDLSWNQIIIPSSTNWNCLKTLETFTLGRNDIKEISKTYTFTSLISLKNLTLSKMYFSLRKIGNKALKSDSLQHLDLSRNGLNFEDHKKVDNDIFYYLPNLTSLDVSYNKFGSVGAQKLTKLSSLERLSMRHVDLSQLPDDFLGNFPNLKHLNLGRNNIEHFTINAFQNVTELKILDLSHNLISNFPVPPFPPVMLKSLEKFNFAYNYFQCDCEIVKLQKWINDVLSDPDKQNLLSRYPDDYWCYKPQSLSHVLLKDAEPNNCKIDQLVLSVVCSAIICLVFTVVLVVAFVYRWEIKFLLHKMRQKRHDGYYPLSFTFEYNTYVAYAEKDSAWVIHDLLKELEEAKCNVYIRDRYSVPGVARCDEIVDNIYKSKTVILVLSKNFMACQWCNYQLNVAQERAVKLGPHFLIPVLLEGIYIKHMKTSAQHLFRTSKPIEWARRSTKNRLFWSELKIALEAEINQEFEESSYQSLCLDTVL